MSYLDEIFGPAPKKKNTSKEVGTLPGQAARSLVSGATTRSRSAGMSAPSSLAESAPATLVVVLSDGGVDRARSARRKAEEMVTATRQLPSPTGRRPRAISPLRRPGKAPACATVTPKRSRGRGDIDDSLLKRATKLAAVAKALDTIDLEALARSHQAAGGSAIDAAAAAAAALNSAILCAAAQGSAAEAVGRVVDKQQKAAKLEHLRRSRQADSEESQVKRDADLEALTAQHNGAAQRKLDRLKADAQRSRTRREHLALATANRREMTKMRAQFGQGWRTPKAPRTYDNPYAGPDTALPADLASDPLLARARAMCASAETVVNSLMSDSLLRGSASEPTFRTRAAPPPALVVSPEEEALVAKTRALLADYDPEKRPGEASPRQPQRPPSDYQPFRSHAITRQNSRRASQDNNNSNNNNASSRALLNGRGL